MAIPKWDLGNAVRAIGQLSGSEAEGEVDGRPDKPPSCLQLPLRSHAPIQGTKSDARGKVADGKLQERRATLNLVPPCFHGTTTWPN